MAGSQAALVSVWFRATYVLIVALAPLTLRLWERWGWDGLIGTIGPAAFVHILDLGSDSPRFAGSTTCSRECRALSGICMGGRPDWRASKRLRRWLRRILGAGAARGRVPYPVAMVGVVSTAVNDSNPSKITLIVLALFQFGLAITLEPLGNDSYSQSVYGRAWLP